MQRRWVLPFPEYWVTGRFRLTSGSADENGCWLAIRIGGSPSKPLRHIVRPSDRATLLPCELKLRKHHDRVRSGVRAWAVGAVVAVGMIACGQNAAPSVQAPAAQ